MTSKINNKFSKNNLTSSGLITPKTNSVYDPEFTRALKNVPWSEWYENIRPLDCRNEYLETYDQWIQKSKLNSIKGLESFPVKHLTNGTTQSFDEFYYKNNSRRLRLFKGEYAYHRRVFKNWKFIEDDSFQKNDALIVSTPFCSHGGVPDGFYETLDRAHELELPVLIDCAYFGTSVDLNIDLSHPAIDQVSFSLTKGVGLGDIRSGIRYSRKEDDMPICQQNKYNHTVLAAAKIGLYMMNKFEPDYIPKKYRQMQLDVCQEAGIEATKCIHIALGGSEWEDFEIDEKFNRLGIRELIKARRKGQI